MWVKGIRGVRGHQSKHLAGACGGVGAAALQHDPDARAYGGVLRDRVHAEYLDGALIGMQKAFA
ncbi:Uncharacterised protein [Mycobacteroides abscessus subsp. abscessus]|nr:Uncharacterised protein [Mycobacteroides abscessus subsp. abscessus]